MHNRWQFFDSNHDAKRLFRWPLKPKAKGGGMSELKNPWRKFIPTMTSLTHMVARCLQKKDDEPPILVLRRVHPIECMRVMGWDLEHYSCSPFCYARTPGEEKEHFLDADLLQDLVGNAWCAWTFTAIKIALLGSINWQVAKQKTEEFRASRVRRGAGDKDMIYVPTILYGSSP